MLFASARGVLMGLSIGTACWLAFAALGNARYREWHLVILDFVIAALALLSAGWYWNYEATRERVYDEAQAAIYPVITADEWMKAMENMEVEDHGISG